MFATPTWKEGVGRLFDFGDALTDYNMRPTPDEADLFAMWLDWRAVGEDIQSALESFHAQTENVRPGGHVPRRAKQSWNLLVMNVESLRVSVEGRSPGLWSQETSEHGSDRSGAR
jgi:hypothetical protein